MPIQKSLETYWMHHVYMYKEDLALNNIQWLIYQINPTKPNHIYLIYMYKEDLVLSNLQWLICHKTKRKPNSILTTYLSFICVSLSIQEVTVELIYTVILKLRSVYYLLIGHLNIHGTHVTDSNSTTNNVFFCVRFENSIYYNNY